jgi:DNA-binding transcriptional regulator YiaG
MQDAELALHRIARELGIPETGNPQLMATEIIHLIQRNQALIIQQTKRVNELTRHLDLLEVGILRTAEERDLWRSEFNQTLATAKELKQEWEAERDSLRQDLRTALGQTEVVHG